jgi:hypothetical protein
VKLGWVMGLMVGAVGTVGIHGGILAFGGWFFLDDEEDQSRLQEVELLTEEAPEDEKK